MVIPDVIGVLGGVTKRIGIGSGGLGFKRMRGNLPSIVEFARILRRILKT